MSNTGNTNNNLPRITDMWGKYAKKSTTTTTVKTNGTTITTNGKTKINIFNNTKASGCWNPPDRRKGNVWLNGRNYNVPVHQWASPYNMGGMQMPSIWSMPSVSVSYSEPELTGWDKFMQFINIIGPGNIAALLGGTLAGIGGAIGSWFSGDDDKTSTSAPTSGPSPAPQNIQPEAAGTKNVSSSKTNKEKFDKITKYQDLPQVEEYNNSLIELSQKQQNVKTAEGQVTTTRNNVTTTEKEVRKCEASITGIKDNLSELKQQLGNLSKDDENYETLKAQLDEQIKSTEEQLSQAETALTEAKDAYKNAQNEYTEAQNARTKAQNELSTETAKVKELKQKAYDAISYVETGEVEDNRSTYEKYAPNFMGGKSKPTFNTEG